VDTSDDRETEECGETDSRDDTELDASGADFIETGGGVATSGNVIVEAVEYLLETFDEFVFPLEGVGTLVVSLSDPEESRVASMRERITQPGIISATIMITIEAMLLR